MRRALPLAAALAGCTFVNPPSDHVAAPIAAEDFCASFAELYCDSVLTCCPPAAAATSRAECIPVLSTYCATSFAPLLNDARTGYDPAEAGYQLAYARELASRCDPAIAPWQSRFDGLVAMLFGTVAEGELCNPTFPERPDTREYDVARFYSCTGDLGCRPATSIEEWRCLARGDRGAPCVGLADCADGLTCVPVSDVRAECRDRLSDGMPCTIDSQCESYECGCTVGGFECDCATGACSCRPDDTAEQVYCGLLQ